MYLEINKAVFHRNATFLATLAHLSAQEREQVFQDMFRRYEFTEKLGCADDREFADFSQIVTAFRAASATVH